MLEYIALLGGTVLSLFFMFSKMKERRSPLKNSDKVAVELNSERALEAFHIYLPTAKFISNMCAAIENERLDLQALWSGEKAKFPLVWGGLSEKQQKTLISTLINELKFSIESYSDTDKLQILLCSKINERYLLEVVENAEIRTSPVGDASKSETTQESARAAGQRVGVEELIVGAQSKADIKPFCLPLLVLAADRVEKELDPNGKEKLDIALTQHVELFLRALQQLCVIKFAKQVLLRYKTDANKSFWLRTAKSVAPVFLFGVLAMFIAYLMDRYGMLGAFMWDYKSPFK